MKMRLHSIWENIEEFKGIYDSVTITHKSLDEDTKVINFVKGLDKKYKILKIVVLGKTSYETFIQFVNTLKGYDIREDDSEKDNANQFMTFQDQKT